MNTKALYNITYGVYLLSANENGKDNACIINTAVQVANNPTRISIAAIKGNLTHDMVLSTGRFNLSAISTDAPYSLFQHFGMQSGRSVDKFADFADVARSNNGLYYLTKYANAFLSLKVTESIDLGSHTLFIAELEDAEVLSNESCCTYGYYQTNINQMLLNQQQTLDGNARSAATYMKAASYQITTPAHFVNMAQKISSILKNS